MNTMSDSNVLGRAAVVEETDICNIELGKTIHGAAVGQKVMSIFPARLLAFLKGEISVLEGPVSGEILRQQYDVRHTEVAPIFTRRKC
jgi:hypothetical protein